MRIALLSVHGDPKLQAGGKDAGGMNIYIREVVEKLINSNVEVDVFTRDHNRKNEIEGHFTNVNVNYIKAGESYIDKVGIFDHIDQFVEGVNEFKKLKNIKYDLIFAHYWLSGVASLKLKKIWNIPVITTFHTMQEIKQEAFPFNIDDPQRETQEKLVSQESDALVVWSKHEKNFIASNYKVDPKKIYIIPPGVDLELFKPIDQKEAREEINIQDDLKVILFVGRLERLKGLDTLLEALSMIDQEKINLLVVGGLYNISEVTRLKKLCNEFNLLEKVHFIGSINRTDLKYYYNSSDICVLPSYYESFGLSALEAAACGVPVVASKKGGLSSIVIDKKTGYLLQWRCPGPFVEKLEILLQSKDLRKSMGKNARQHAEKLNWDESINSLKHLFNKLTSN
tara:strand:+ start:766 stop:1956 length:1191 start_codon:yes stop_codon:yes gene_type:complete